MEWFSLLVPMVAGLVLHYRFHKHVVWWEVLIPMLPVFIIVPVVKFSAETYQTRDYERHGGWCVKAVYVEDWDEWITQTCTRTVGSGKDATTETYDCSYCQYHPTYWYLIDSNGYNVPLNSSQFEWLATKFSSRQFVDMHRCYHSNDGDEYHAIWSGDDASFQPVTTEHTYENRVQATHGIFDFPEIDNPKALGLYDFPALDDPLADSAVLGHGDKSPEADQILQRYNAKMGRRKEIRVWLLLFHDKPLQTAFDQESYWKGGNKNELVVCIGQFANQGPWCHVFCWSPDGNATNDRLKIEIRDFVQSHGKHGLDVVAQFVTGKATELFTRKHFKEFSYLTVDTPGWAVVLIYVLVIIFTGGLSVWVLNNETTDDNPTGSIDNAIEWVGSLGQ